MKKLIAVLAALMVFAPAALAAGSSLSVSPKKVKAGKSVTVSGTVKGCSGPATIISSAFKSKQSFAGVPSVSAPVDSAGKFSVKVKIKKKAKGKYSVTGRCGGGNFGSATLKVKKASGGGNPGFY